MRKIVFEAEVGPFSATLSFFVSFLYFKKWFFKVWPDRKQTQDILVFSYFLSLYCSTIAAPHFKEVIGVCHNIFFIEIRLKKVSTKITFNLIYRGANNNDKRIIVWAIGKGNFIPFNSLAFFKNTSTSEK